MQYDSLPQIWSIKETILCFTASFDVSGQYCLRLLSTVTCVSALRWLVDSSVGGNTFHQSFAPLWINRLWWTTGHVPSRGDNIMTSHNFLLHIIISSLLLSRHLKVFLLSLYLASASQTDYVQLSIIYGLAWNSYTENVCIKVDRTLDFRRRILTKDVIRCWWVRSEYVCPVWALMFKSSMKSWRFQIGILVFVSGN